MVPSETSSTVHKLRVEEVDAPAPKRTAPPPPTPSEAMGQIQRTVSASDQTPTTSPSSSVLELVIAALSARSLLLLALIGAFVLALLVMFRPSYLDLGVFVGYCLFTIVPLVFLEVRSRG